MTKYTLVTGTTSGIGKALARLMASEGHQLVLVSRDEAKLQAQADNLKKTYKIEVIYLAMDLTQKNAAALIYEELKKRAVEIDCLVNNAGFNECGDFLHTNFEHEKSMIDLHISFLTQMTKLILPDMIANRNGKILNLGSTGSHMYCPGDAVYAATKAYILLFSQALSAELKNTGVSVTVLCPGSTKTDFAAKAGMEGTLLFKLFVMDAEKVAKIGYQAMMKGKRVVITGLYNKALVVGSKVMPKFIFDPLTKKMLAVT